MLFHRSMNADEADIKEFASYAQSSYTIIYTTHFRQHETTGRLTHGALHSLAAAILPLHQSSLAGLTLRFGVTVGMEGWRKVFPRDLFPPPATYYRGPYIL